MMPRPAERACHGRVAEPHMPRGDSIRILNVRARRRVPPQHSGLSGGRRRESGRLKLRRSLSRLLQKDQRPGRRPANGQVRLVYESVLSVSNFVEINDLTGYRGTVLFAQCSTNFETCYAGFGIQIRSKPHGNRMKAKGIAVVPCRQNAVRDHLVDQADCLRQPDQGGSGGLRGVRPGRLRGSS